MNKNYYEQELRYLYESGKEFSRNHPETARFLDISSIGDRDPYVERLFEGFAFLTARIREQADSSFNNLSSSLTRLLWPQFLHEIPSLTIVEFKARKGFVQESKILRRGLELLTGPTGEENAICKFRTTKDVCVYPFSLKNSTMQNAVSGQGIISLYFQLEHGAIWNSLGVSSIDLHIHAESPIAFTCHELLVNHVVKGTFHAGEQSVQIAGSEIVKPGGLSNDETLVPGTPESFMPCALLQEYFVFPEKFLFVSLQGLNVIKPDQEFSEFRIDLLLDVSIPNTIQFGEGIFKLFCTPAINMFPYTCEPVSGLQWQEKAKIVPDYHLRKSIMPLGVISVTGVDKDHNERTTYSAAGSFAQKNTGTGTYECTYAINEGDNREMFIGIRLNDADTKSSNVNISIDAWCSNGTLPRHELKEGGLNKPGPGFPEMILFRDIKRPTLPFVPPDNSGSLEIFLRHLNATIKSLTNVEMLKSFLNLYNWSGDSVNTKRIDSILQLSMEPVQMIHSAGIVRGLEYTISVQEKAWEDTHDLYLFLIVLQKFLGHYVSINTFITVILMKMPSGQILKSSSFPGGRCLI